jgi:hypothetical protein
MATTMVALNSSSINYADFVRITLPETTYTFCNAAAPITVDGITFDGLSGLLGFNDIQQDIKATSKDLTVSLTGIDSEYISLLLSSEIKGSVVEIWRGFLNSNNQIITTPTQQFFKRYQGIINSVSISEEFNQELRQRVATCSIACASFRLILENRLSGVRTVGSVWRDNHPNDTSMDRVQLIVSTYFDFGQKPKGGSQSTSSAPSQYTLGTFGD